MIQDDKSILGLMYAVSNPNGEPMDDATREKFLDSIYHILSERRPPRECNAAHIKVNELQRGDIIVVSSSKHLTPQQVDAVARQFTSMEIPDDVHVAVFSGDVHLQSVLRPPKKINMRSMEDKPDAEELDIPSFLRKESNNV